MRAGEAQLVRWYSGLLGSWALLGLSILPGTLPGIEQGILPARRANLGQLVADHPVPVSFWEDDGTWNKSRKAREPLWGSGCRVLMLES
jgi:hypothetical protein